MRITFKSVFGRGLLWVLAEVALLAGCGPGAASRGATASPGTASQPITTTEREPRPPGGPGAPLVECAPSDFLASPLTRQSSLPALEDWPLDGSDAAPGSSKESPVLRCGPRDSYGFVAGVYRCADGSNPLGGNIGAGGAARRGNVGPNSQHHIIDLYEVPCASGAEKVYVDMYGCPDEPKRQASPEGLRINDDLPPAVESLMREALDLAGDDKNAEAIAKIQQALALFEKTVDATHPNRGRLLDLLGSLQQESELADEAERSLAAAYRVWAGVAWPPISLIGNTCVRLARLYAARKQASLALCVAGRGIAYLEDVKGQFDARIISSLYLMAEIYQAQGQLDVAERLLRRGVRLTELSHGRRHPRVQVGLAKLEALYLQRGDTQSAEALRRRGPQRESSPNKI